MTQVKIIGVEPSDANAMALSLHHGRRVTLDEVGGFADGVAVKVVGEETFRLCRELLDGVVLVSRDAICASIKVSFLFGSPKVSSSLYYALHENEVVMSADAYSLTGMQKRDFWCIATKDYIFTKISFLIYI